MKKNMCIRFSLIICLYLLVNTQFEAYSISNNDTIQVGNKEQSDKFTNWTEEQYKAYEDSILSKLYPPITICKTERTSTKINKDNDSNNSSRQSINIPFIPTTVNIDKTKEVGEIPISTGTTPTGAKTYSIPINAYPGINGFTPELSLIYSSQQQNGVVGNGWSISGISMITRGGKSIYYDGKTEGIKMNAYDSFYLNGMRLLQSGHTSEYILYESEQGNIKAKGFFSGSIMKYFEVYFPDGRKGIFGYMNNTLNSHSYPLITLTNIHEDKIDYQYQHQNGFYNIIKISYNGCSLEFNYTDNREDPILLYCGGSKIHEHALLKSIDVKFGTNTLWTYTLSHTLKNNHNLLSKVELSADNKSYNPLYFYYGEGFNLHAYTSSSTQLLEWYKPDNPNMIRAIRGRFDYESGMDGIIVLPNYNPYWKHYRAPALFWHSQNRFVNQYTGNEKIFLYAGLDDDFASPMPNLLTGEGFIDILCADLVGKQQEYIIKINNKISLNKDNLTFEVYRPNLYTGIGKLYTRSFYFDTVYTDADGGQSVQPKFFYTGDFNGDGKMEILGISTHQPFGDISKPSKCYIFDLENGRIMYQSQILQYNVDFVGTQQTDPELANNNSDRIIVMDYDGDGKTEICHINGNGLDIYSFSTSGTTITGLTKLVSYSEINKVALENRLLLMGELNGDGLMDLLVSPKSSNSSDKTWKVFNSMAGGDGFEETTFDGPIYKNIPEEGFIVQDVNNDGISDLIKYFKRGYSTYLANGNRYGASTCEATLPDSIIKFIPVNINSRNNFSQLICLKGGIATQYSFTSNCGKELLATGMVNSFGVFERNRYSNANGEGIAAGVYDKGHSAVYPYINIQEAIPIIAFSQIFVNGKQISKQEYSYKNAVLHRQGLGFCGFEEISSTNHRGHISVSTYDPYNRGILKSLTSDTFKGEYEYSISTQPYRLLKIHLTKKTEKDLLKNISVTTSYKYDSYGNPTEEITDYSDNTKITKNYSYYNQTTVGDGYNLGFMTNMTIQSTRDEESYTEELKIPARSKRQANVKLYYINGNAVKEETFTYDSHGNLTKHNTRPYSSTEYLQTQFEYDSFGRVSKKTDAMGLISEFSYNELGQLISIKDARGGFTKFSYDEFGRQISIEYPDKSIKNSSIAWALTVPGALYETIQTSTGQPTVVSYNDLLNRKVRETTVLVDGSIKKIDRVYDEYGRLSKVSLPFTDDSATNWNTYSYDHYDRITTYTSASGESSENVYSNNSITTTSDNISQTKTYNDFGNLISVSDPAGDITYKYSVDGKIDSITLADNITTNVVYDTYRRRTSLTDPSSGTTLYEYDAAGNISKETDANGAIRQFEYDKYNRIKKSICPEFTTTYLYDEYGNLTDISSSNGTSKSFEYDSFGRLSQCIQTVNGIWLQKDYSYSQGNISNIKYSTISGILGSEFFQYSNGNLKTMVFGVFPFYTLSSLNSMGMPSLVKSGNLSREYNYSSDGLLTGRKGYLQDINIQDISYTFDPFTNNLLSRSDNINNKTEDFEYDELNRLISFGSGTTDYDSKGNIISQSGIANLSYNLPEKPYAVSEVNQFSNKISKNTQEISYTSFSRPEAINEGDSYADFKYNSDYDRVYMGLLKDDGEFVDKYYLGDCYEFEETPETMTERLYLGGDYYSAPAVVVKKDGVSKLYFILRDHLGSITNIVLPTGRQVQELSYDAWGRLRNPQNHEIYSPGEEPELFLGRGYTGHEHLQLFGLINMNARLYDPALGRFLSPDPYIQLADFTQSFNRYSYCLNNPLRYVDQNGEIAATTTAFLFGAAIGAYFGGVIGNGYEYNPTKWNYRSGTTWGCMAAGGLVGGFSGLVGYHIACSGIPMANTFAIMGASITNSVGTKAYTGGQTPIMMSFGVASYDFTNKQWGWLWKDGNSKLENAGYLFGGLNNISDLVSLLFGGGGAISVNSASKENDWWGHSSITDSNQETLISVGPKNSAYNKISSISKSTGLNQADTNWPSYINEPGTWSIKLNNISINNLNKYASLISKWDILFKSCVAHSTWALWSAGVPSLYLFHPMMLNIQMGIRQIGTFASPFIYQIPKI